MSYREPTEQHVRRPVTSVTQSSDERVKLIVFELASTVLVIRSRASKAACSPPAVLVARACV